jgi:hypothetical protein
MEPEEREKLESEWKYLQEKNSAATSVNPSDMRRMDQITSLLMTDGESDSVKLNFVKGRPVTKGMNFSKPYSRKGKVG